MPYKYPEDEYNNRIFWRLKNKEWYSLYIKLRYQRYITNNPNHCKDARKRALELNPNLDKEHYQKYKGRSYNGYQHEKELHPDLCQRKYKRALELNPNHNKEHYQKYKNKPYNKIRVRPPEYYQNCKEYYYKNKKRINRTNRIYYREHREELCFKERQRKLNKRINKLNNQEGIKG